MSCCAVGCTNRAKKKCNISFFRFPMHDPDRLDQWVQRMRRMLFTPNKFSRLCSDHFESHCFTKDLSGRTLLTNTAVPTIFFFNKDKQKVPRRVLHREYQPPSSAVSHPGAARQQQPNSKSTKPKKELCPRSETSGSDMSEVEAHMVQVQVEDQAEPHMVQIQVEDQAEPHMVQIQVEDQAEPHMVQIQVETKIEPEMIQDGEQLEYEEVPVGDQVEAQVAHILEVLVSAAVSEVSKVMDRNTGDKAEAEQWDQKVFHLSLVMAALAQDAVDKLCQLFYQSKMSSQLLEVEELRRRLQETESDLKQALDKQQSREEPMEDTEGPRQDTEGPQKKQTSGGASPRRVVVICDSALRRMPFFRLWAKSKKNKVKRVRVQQDEDEDEESSQAPHRGLDTDQGHQEGRVEQMNGQIHYQDHPLTPEEPAEEPVEEPAEEVEDNAMDEAEEDDGAEAEETQEKPAEEQPVESQLDFINKQTAYISKLVKKVRTASEDKSVRRKKRPPPNPAEAVSCSVCDKVFHKQKLLDIHMLVHTGEKPHLCDVCGKSFMLRSSLLTHQRKHNATRSFTCDTCGKSFHLKPHLTRHQTVHTQHKPYKCQYCGKAFRNTGNLKRHVFIHTGERPYTCDICGRAFIQNVTLQAHRLTHTGQKPFRCHCGKTYTQRNTLTMHQLTHDDAESWDRPVTCVACGATMTRDAMTEHLKTHQTPLACVRCEMPLLTEEELRNHQSDHTGKRPFFCHICGKNFQSYSYLKIHISNHNKDSEGKPYHCTVCGRTFAHQATLTYHMNVHSGLKPYACQICGKTFSNPGNVSRHQLVHTGEKPYSCQLCSRSFNQSCTLKAHLRTHTGHKPYQCDNCGRSFCDKRNLKEHKCRT